MLAIEARFLLGRFHATPWGHHPNEGIPEWPPSPWRLLRALYASSRLFPEDGDEEALAQLFKALSSSPPSFHLPVSTLGHSRHYVPIKKGRALLLNAFVAVEPDEPVVFLWSDLILPASQEAFLDKLLRGIGYLGRSESLVELTRSDKDWPANACPAGNDDVYDLVSLLCSNIQVSPDQVSETTASMRKKGRRCPPGARAVSYQLKPARRLPRRSTTTLVTFGLDTQREIGRGATLAIADRVRRALLSLGTLSPTLLGKEEGEHRTDGHRHLHILPDGDPCQDELTIVRLWAPEGFSDADLDVLARLRKVPAERKKSSIALLPLGAEGPGAFGLSSTWTSYTPFLLTRHPRTSGADSPEEQVKRECANRGLPRPRVEVLPDDGREWQVHRGPRKGPPGPPAWFRLTFPSPIPGPLCLGGAAHFGMGRFVPSP